LSPINQSIVIVAMPPILRGIHLNPLVPANTSHVLWILLGFMVVMGDPRRQPRARRRHVRPGPHVRPRLRGVHGRLGAAVDYRDARQRGRDLVDRDAHRCCVVGAAESWLRGGRYYYSESYAQSPEPKLEAELVDIA
jgi:hypothetical protein